MITKDQLDQLAHKALEVSNGTAEWIAIDFNGLVFAYKFRPVIKGFNWYVIKEIGKYNCWPIGDVERPEYYFTDEIYEISKLLKNDN